MNKKKIKAEEENTEMQDTESIMNEETQDEELLGDINNDCEDTVSRLENELKEAYNKHLRLIAEYDNYRKRTLKEKMELSKTAGEKILIGILPLVDDFERALQHIDKAADVNAVKEGTVLIYNKFIKFLSQQGVKAIDVVGNDFDADIYEAVTKIPAPNEEMKGKVLDCVEKGYVLDDKVMRYPKVVVGE
ncbi:MAG: nucleotide exchange factor GrpE [Cytophagaceae bacterium]|jgi:molecular chaperone GrpE|nr:nucleotide exchange factor GrpE [Cytophagaceae bacterium]